MRKLLAYCMLLVAGMTTLHAAGPHEGITCLGCHSPHYAVDNKIFAVKNTIAKNPLTGESIQDLVASKCLGCHQTTELGGAGVKPIHLHTTHPLGIVPNKKIADVPENLLSKGKLDCISCHDPHPSNTNFMYLRVDTGAQGENLQNFCTACHSAKADLTAMGVTSGSEIQIFTSMNQEKGAGTYSRDEADISNETPEYVTPLGENKPNDITPNYQNPPDWVYAPDLSKIKSSAPAAQ